jgi:hypothetical protein
MAKVKIYQFGSQVFIVESDGGRYRAALSRRDLDHDMCGKGFTEDEAIIALFRLVCAPAT